MSQRKFAVFDIDGTIFRSHLYWEVVIGLAQRRKFHKKLNTQTTELYQAWKRREYKDAFEKFDKDTIAAIDGIIHELDPQSYDAVLEEILTPLLDHTYTYTRDRLKELQKQGYFTIALSGSRIEEVTLFAKHHGFDDWIGQTYERSEDGKSYTGKVAKTHQDKHLILENFVTKHDLTYKDSWGFGDTLGDLEMLEAVENAVAFNPNRAMLAAAKNHGWNIVVERKNVIYELAPARDDSYRLL